MEYRTLEQFIQVCENASNSNWSDAYENCVEYGIYSQDLIRMQEELKEQEMQIIEDIDLCIISEGAMKLRGKKNMI